MDGPRGRAPPTLMGWLPIIDGATWIILDGLDRVAFSFLVFGFCSLFIIIYQGLRWTRHFWRTSRGWFCRKRLIGYSLQTDLYWSEKQPLSIHVEPIISMTLIQMLESKLMEFLCFEFLDHTLEYTYLKYTCYRKKLWQFLFQSFCPWQNFRVSKKLFEQKSSSKEIITTGA